MNKWSFEDCMMKFTKLYAHDNVKSSEDEYLVFRFFFYVSIKQYKGD